MSKKKSHRKASATPQKTSLASAAAPARGRKTTGAVHRQTKDIHGSSASRRWLWVTLGALAILAAVAAVTYFITRPSPQPAIVQIPADQAFQKYQSGAFFLDVRSQAEWEEVHIPNSTLIPLDELESRLAELPRDREIVVVCLVGKRSQLGQQILAGAGFEHAFCLQDGLQAWQAAGYPTESS